MAGGALGFVDLAGAQQTLGGIASPLVSLFVTLACESFVGVGFALWRQKPVKSLFLSSVFVNGITQPLLWLGLMVFYRHYFRALILAEGLIFFGEAYLMKRISANRLSVQEAFLLSFLMNGLSFGVGLWLPF